MHIVRAMTRLTLISLDDTVVFPGMPVTLALDAGTDKHIFLMPRHGNQYAKVGVVAEIKERVQLPGRGVAVFPIGLHPGVPPVAPNHHRRPPRGTRGKAPAHRSPP